MDGKKRTAKLFQKSAWSSQHQRVSWSLLSVDAEAVVAQAADAHVRKTIYLVHHFVNVVTVEILQTII